MISMYCVPILYVLSIYIIPILSYLGVTLPSFIFFVPLVLGIANIVVAFLLKTDDSVFASAVLVKYSLIPFFVFGGVLILFCFILGIIPHLSFLMITNIAFIFIGYILMLLGSAYQISYILRSLKNSELNIFIAIVMIIASFIFVLDVICVMILSLFKIKYRKLTIFVLALILFTFIFLVLYFICAFVIVQK